MTLEIDIVTLFPAMLEGPLAASIPAGSRSAGSPTIRVHDLRRWGLGRHRSVDDAPYGGGAGMVIRPEPVAAALGDAAPAPTRPSILLDPAGEPFRQARADELAGREPPRPRSARATRASTSAIRALVDLELSIGDYVLTGGELPALVVIDAVLRLLPGAIDDASIDEESFADGLLEYPQYTRPAEFEGAASRRSSPRGDHGAVRRWRLREAHPADARATAGPAGRSRVDPLRAGAARRDPVRARRGRRRLTGERAVRPWGRAILRRRSPRRPLPNAHPAARAARREQEPP